jgi:PIN domain nuclease of toxin-antitoxin system
MDRLVPLAMPLSWTRDPFDRLLVATALLHEAPLITRDARIQEHFAGAVW